MIRNFFFIGLFLLIGVLSGKGIYGENFSPDYQAVEKAQNAVILDQRNRERAAAEEAKFGRSEAPAAYAVPEVMISTENAGSLPSFKVDQILIFGNQAIPIWTLRQFTKPYLRREITVQDIQVLVKTITNYYLKKGYVTTRVYIPKQNLKKGILILQIQEGFVTRIEYGGPASHVWTAFPGIEKQVLQIRRAEQGVAQMNRLAMNAVSIELYPDPDVTGGSVLKLHNERGNRSSAILHFDTLLHDQLSLMPSSFSFSHDNALELNDHETLDFYQHFRSGNQFTNSVAASFSLPYGPFLGTVKYSQLDYMNLVRGQSRNFTTSGRDQEYSGSLSMILGKGQRGETTADAGLRIKKTASYVEDVLNNVGSRKLVVASGGITQQLASPFGNWVASFHLNKGLSGFGAISPASDAGAFDPTGQFLKFESEIEWTNRVYWGQFPLTFNGSVYGSYSRQSLFSSEQMSIGDLTTVRGYGTSYQGDYGGRGRVELTYPVNLWGQSLMVFQGIDAGVVYLHGGREVNGDLAKVVLMGAGTGFRARFWDRLSLSFTWGIPIKASPFVSKQNWPLYLSVGWTLI